MANECMLTTVDNPYNPFAEYEEWWAYDSNAGYHTPSYLARVVRTSDELSYAKQLEAIEQGIDEIVKDNLFGIYKKVIKQNK